MDNKTLHNLINIQMSLNEGISRSINALYKADIIPEPTLYEAERYIAAHGATALLKGIVYETPFSGKQTARYNLPAAITAINVLIQDIPSRDSIAEQLSSIDPFALVSTYRKGSLEAFANQLSFHVTDANKLPNGECTHDH